MKKCNWQCGRKTANRTRICDPCWRNREAIYLERKAREAAAKKNPKRQSASRKANEAKKQAKLTAELPALGLLDAGQG
jgi:hypothetical protein